MISAVSPRNENSTQHAATDWQTSNRGGTLSPLTSPNCFVDMLELTEDINHAAMPELSSSASVPVRCSGSRLIPWLGAGCSSVACKFSMVDIGGDSLAIHQKIVEPLGR